MGNFRHSNWLANVILIILLLLTQQQMILHTASHIQAPAQHQQDSDSDNLKICHDCSVLTQYGSALSPIFTHLHLDRFYSTLISFTAVSTQTATVLAFDSRAPPRI